MPQLISSINCVQNFAAWHTFYLLTGDSKTNPDSTPGLNLPTHVALQGKDDMATLWVHFRAAEREKALSPGSLGAPEQVSAKLDVWLDVPDGGVPITSVTLRATVGLAKLNIPRALAVGEAIDTAAHLRGRVMHYSLLKAVCCFILFHC